VHDDPLSEPRVSQDHRLVRWLHALLRVGWRASFSGHGVVGLVGAGGGGEREEAPLALDGTRAHAVGYRLECGEEQGEIETPPRTPAWGVNRLGFTTSIKYGTVRKLVQTRFCPWLSLMNATN